MCARQKTNIKFDQEHIAPVYLFYGEEDYLRRRALRELVGCVLQKETGEFNYDLVDGEEDSLEKVLTLAQTPPFLASRRLVVVRYAPYFAGRGRKVQSSAPGPEETKKTLAPGEKSLLAYLQNPVDTTCLVFETGQPVDQRRKLFKVLQKTAQVIEFPFLRHEELIRWLLQRAGAAGKKMAPGTADLLISRAGRGMTLLENELNKLISYVGERNIIANEDVQMVTVPMVEENIFAVVDALGERQVRKALGGIKELLADGEPAPVILTMVARQFRLLLQAKEMAAKGGQPAQMGTQLGVPPFVVKKILAQSKNFSFEQLQQTLEQLLELDVVLKTGRQEFLPAMEKLALNLLTSKTGG